jgi:hypothetical protein
MLFNWEIAHLNSSRAFPPRRRCPDRPDSELEGSAIRCLSARRCRCDPIYPNTGYEEIVNVRMPPRGFIGRFNIVLGKAREQMVTSYESSRLGFRQSTATPIHRR